MLPPKTSHEVDLSRLRSGADGIYLDELAEGAVVEIETKNHNYRMVKHCDTHVCISGHPTYFPEPVEVEIEASIGEGYTIQANPRFIGPGMRLILTHPRFNRITTSLILGIHKC
jgi:hypothetical protein